MKFILPFFFIFLLSCGNDAQPIDHHTNSDGSFHTSLPAGTPMISERYICIDGFSADKSFSNRELNNIRTGLEIFNDHAQSPGLAHLTDKETNCKIIKDPNLYVGTQFLGEANIRSDNGTSSGHDVVISFWDRVLLFASYFYSDEPTQDLYYATIVAHETFHSAGAAHLPDDVSGLMNHRLSTVPIWTDADEQLCRAIFICPK